MAKTGQDQQLSALVCHIELKKNQLYSSGVDTK
jgi:hypothetical protein